MFVSLHFNFVAMQTLIKNIKELVGVESAPKLRKQGREMAELETVKDAYLLVEDGKIAAFGPMSEWKVERGKWKVEKFSSGIPMG